MNCQILILIALSIIGEIYCDCGCLKCGKDLTVVSPPYLPYKVIVKGPCDRPLPYQRENPSYIPINPETIDYPQPCQLYAYKYKVEVPVIPPPLIPPPINGLVARPDRIVIQSSCPPYTADDGSCDVNKLSRPPCRSIFNNYGGNRGPLVLVEGKRRGPILEPITGDFYSKIGCDCRYALGHGTRKKRELPILKKSVRFLMGLLPHFLRFPIEQTLKSLNLNERQYHKPNQKYYKVPYHKILIKPSETFLEKLLKLNRAKRSLIFHDDKISLPFLRVTNVENELEDSEEEEDSEDEDPTEEYLRPLNFDHLVPHNPIFYFLNAPIRFLHHFHKLGQKISPVFKSVPHVFLNSKRYLRNFGKNLRNDVLNFASDFIGDFDPVDAHRYRYLKPRRFRRDLEEERRLEQYEPEYSLVFGNDTENSRKKRYILKVVDEDEVEKFLRERLGGLVEPTERTKKKREKEKDGNKRRLVVEQLAPKLIIDNNGRPFFEMNGAKRPLFLKKEPKEDSPEVVEEKPEENNEDMKERINSIIKQARERIDQNHIASPPQNVPSKMIKDRTNQILTEIQDLINLDFDKYSTIHGDLCKLESFKEILVNEWKKILMENKCNDIPSKILLLDEFKEMQILRDKCVQDIASTLSTGSNFMTKKLIKMLVRLQKLQCIIYRVVEDFGEKIKMGTDFDLEKEFKYVEYMSGLHFIVGMTQQDLENDLKRERDITLENELRVLESLRKLAEGKYDSQKLYEEAQLLWEIKNIDKLQKDAIVEMNGKIERGQKVRKELKILFDLLRQLENCEEKQMKLFEELAVHKQEEEIKEIEKNQNEEETFLFSGHEELKYQPRENFQREKIRHKNRNSRRKTATESTNFHRNNNFPHRTIIEDKKPIKLVSNGYAMTAYKVSDGFD